MSAPARGEVWLADLGSTAGHEQAGRRPVLVVSIDSFNAGKSGLAVVLPITSTVRNLPLHVSIAPPEGGLKTPSAILCDAVRSVDQNRLILQWGSVSTATMLAVEVRLRQLFGL